MGRRVLSYGRFKSLGSRQAESVAERFLGDLEKVYDLRRGKPFDKFKGNCAWFTVKFSEWAEQKGIVHEIVYFPETGRAPDAHIAPMVGGRVIDFAHKQFSGDVDELYRITRPEHYREFGYDGWEVYGELPDLETVYSLERK